MSEKDETKKIVKSKILGRISKELASTADGGKEVGHIKNVHTKNPPAHLKYAKIPPMEHTKSPSFTKAPPRLP